LSREIENIDDLLGKYLSGEASQSELLTVDQWLRESDANQRYFDQLRKIFEGAAAIRERKEYDTDAAWNKVRDNLKRRSTPVIPLNQPRKNSWPEWWKVAATVLLLAGAGLFTLLSNEEDHKPIEVVAESRAVSDTLPDGSDIFLNRKTKVVYAYDAKTRTHDVKLKGEAYFNIKTSKREQFIIDAGDVFVKDIGTSFNVKAYPESDVVEVLVEEGEIIFFTADNPGIRLKESGKAVYNKKTKQFTIDQPDPNVTAYKTKFFVFSDTRLGAVADALNHVYDTHVVVPGHLKNCPITVSFRDETIEEIAAIIGETLNLTVSTENGSIVLNGNGCE
jgi:transmembrane sensor